VTTPNTWGRRFGKRDHNNKEDELRISRTRYDFVESHNLHLNVGTLKQLNMVVFGQFNASHFLTRGEEFCRIQNTQCAHLLQNVYDDCKGLLQVSITWCCFIWVLAYIVWIPIQLSKFWIFKFWSWQWAFEGLKTF
jgi:hypothetical protein